MALFTLLAYIANDVWLMDHIKISKADLPLDQDMGTYYRFGICLHSDNKLQEVHLKINNALEEITNKKCRKIRIH